MLVMAVVGPVILMILIGCAVGLLLRWQINRWILTLIGTWLACGMIWAAGSWVFLALVAPAEAKVNWPADLPNLLRAVLLSGLIGLLPAVLIGRLLPKVPLG